MSIGYSGSFFKVSHYICFATGGRQRRGCGPLWPIPKLKRQLDFRISIGRFPALVRIPQSDAELTAKHAPSFPRSRIGHRSLQRCHRSLAAEGLLSVVSSAHRLPIHAFESVEGGPNRPQRPRMPSRNFSRSSGVICSQRSAMRRRQCIP